MVGKVSDGLVLVTENQSDFLIALPDNADQAVVFAAEEMQRYLELITGVRLSCVEEISLSVVIDEPDGAKG